jgi:hypothetical protein
LVLTLSGQNKCAFYQLENWSGRNLTIFKKANTNFVSCISNKDSDHSYSCIPLMDQGKMRKLLMHLIKQWCLHQAQAYLQGKFCKLISAMINPVSWLDHLFCRKQVSCWISWIIWRSKYWCTSIVADEDKQPPLVSQVRILVACTIRWSYSYRRQWASFLYVFVC